MRMILRDYTQYVWCIIYDSVLCVHILYIVKPLSKCPEALALCIECAYCIIALLVTVSMGQNSTLYYSFFLCIYVHTIEFNGLDIMGIECQAQPCTPSRLERDMLKWEVVFKLSSARARSTNASHGKMSIFQHLGAGLVYVFCCCCCGISVLRQPHNIHTNKPATQNYIAYFIRLGKYTSRNIYMHTYTMQQQQAK